MFQYLRTSRIKYETSFRIITRCIPLLRHYGVRGIYGTNCDWSIQICECETLGSVEDKQLLDNNRLQLHKTKFPFKYILYETLSPF